MLLFWFSQGFTQTFALLSTIGFKPPLNADSSLNRMVSSFFDFQTVKSICIREFLLTLDLKLSIVFTSPQDCQKNCKKFSEGGS